ncbi:hypothetical protein ACQCX2_14860 [Propionibacteriaceae bacterium Y1700]|uniref:WXG100-like domain-containing protein n=1 Tax=Microlunatus sp. Y1700 TaxID=3418487 RepID=UPI003DA77F9B
MAVMLPPEVSGLLHLLGYEWPEGNEDRVMEMAAGWQSFAAALDQQVSLGEQARQHVVGANEGPAIEAFGAAFAEVDAASTVTQDLGSGSATIGSCLYVMAAAIVTLKVVVVIQLALLAISIAQAIAAAVPTAGASLTLVPLMKIATQLALNVAINQAVNAVMGS